MDFTPSLIIWHRHCVSQSSSSSNVHLTSASVQVSKRPEPPWTWFRSHKVLIARGLRSCVQESKRKLLKLYIYASPYTYASSIYIKDNPLRVKVTESLGHLGQWRRKVLIINELSASKKRPRRGFASWTSWTAPLVQDQCSSQSGTHGKPRHAHGILPNVKILSPLAGFSK